ASNDSRPVRSRRSVPHTRPNCRSAAVDAGRVLGGFASARGWGAARVGVRLVRDPPAPIDASNREIVDEVATEVISLDEDRDARVADQVDRANVGSVIRTSEAWLGFDELGEVGDR